MSTNVNGFRFPLFVKGDFDGFVGLFIDNLVNLLLITGLCAGLLGMPSDIVFGKILPGTALSVLAGNIFYSWQAHRLAKKEKRLDVTALPYGINTVTLLVFFFLIIMPVYLQHKDSLGAERAADLAWKVGIVSCFISGFFEGIGAFWGEKIRSITPRAALLSALSGIAITWIALHHTVQFWDKPLIAFIPFAFILIEYFSHAKLPFKIPAGLYALTIGATIAWVTGAMDAGALRQSTETLSFYVPKIAIFDMFKIDMSLVWPYLSLAIPLGLMSFFATIQNLESAAAAGDKFPATPSLAMNGVGTIIGAILGSPFPTTVYIGHPGWKALGARAGYSVLNGLVVTILALSGIMGIVKAIVPLEAGYPILLWIGVVITAQAFQTTPKEHAPAVALGLLPAIAGWGVSLLRQYIGASQNLGSAQADLLIMQHLPALKSIIAFQEGALFSSMFFTAVAVYLIEKDFLKAFWWSLPLVVCSYFGFINSTSVGIGMAGKLPAGYLLFSGTILAIYMYNRFSKSNSNC
ncbi:MAG: NCS2 family permease [Spirochaetes bacterium]|nr:NCS2 family permease [Spirochaetota bacterium]